MADANIRVKVTSVGDEELAKNAASTAASYKSVEASLKGAAASSNRISKPVANAKLAAKMEESIDYGIARSSVGTGAAGRDFAQQAQGLGGLVHLYATFAANIFAATAAFTALSKAADTTNMVKGLDQLGAASGRNLGSLSKRISEITDGAISMRTAMEAVTKTSSAGLSTGQIERLATVAKSASQALGLEMTDAISRLSRGISKIEPELLDELGIYVKLDKATQEYARSIGKTVTSLTDFERRQAYAIAVLDEAESKFSSIDIDANPYSKLLASLANTGQKIGEIINSVLGPFARLLAENTGLLSAALALVVGKLVSNAIPALSQWRTNLHKTAQEAAKASSDIVNSFGERFVEKTWKEFKVPDLKRQLGIAEAQFEQAGKNYAAATTDAIATGFIGSKTKLAEALKDTTKPLDAQMRGQLNSAITRATKEGNEAVVASLVRVREENEKLTTSAIKAAKASTAYHEASDSALNKASEGVKKYGQEWQRLEISRKAASKAERLSILASVSQAGKEGGIGEAFDELNKKVKDNSILTSFDKIRTRATGTFIAIAGAISTAAQAFNKFLFYIGLAVTAFSILDSFLSSKNAGKSLKEANTAFDNLESSAENLSRTLEVISKKDPLEKLSASSIMAKTQALSSISEAIVAAFDKAEKAIAERGWWERIFDFVKRGWSGDIQSKFNAQFSEGLYTVFKSLSGSPAELEAKKTLKNMLGYQGEDLEGIEEAFSKLTSSGRMAVKALIDQFALLQAKTKEANAGITALIEAQKTTTKISKDFLNSFSLSDPVAKFATAAMDESRALLAALSNPFTKMTSIIEAFKSSTTIPPSIIKEFSQIAVMVEQSGEQFETAKRQAEEYKVKLSQVTAELGSLQRPKVQGAVLNTKEDTNRLIDEKTNEQAFLKQQQEVAEENAKKYSEAFKKGEEFLTENLYKVFDRSSKLMTARLSSEFAKASATLYSGLAGIFGDSISAILLKRESEKLQIQAERDVISSQIELGKQIDSNTLELKIANARTRLESAKRSNEANINDAYQGEVIDLVPLQQDLKALEDSSKRLALAWSGNLSQLNKDLNGAKGNLAEQQEILNAIGTAHKVLAANVKLSQLSTQEWLSALKAAVDILRKRNQQEVELLDNKIKLLKIEQDISALFAPLGEQSAILASEYKRQYDAKLSIYELNKLEFAQKAAIVEKEKELAIYEGKRAAADPKSNDYKVANDAAVETKNALAFLRTQQGVERSLLLQSQLQRDIATSFTEINALAAAEASILAHNYSISSKMVDREIESNNLSKSLIEARKAAGLITEKQLITQKHAADLLSIELTKKKAILDLDQKTATDRAKLETKEKQLAALKVHLALQGKTADEQSLAVEKDITIERERINSSYGISLTNILLAANGQKTVLDLTKETALETLKWQEAIERVSSAAESMSTAFGSVGAAVGAALEVLIKFAQTQEQNAKLEKSLEDSRANAARIGDLTAEAAIIEEQDKQRKKAHTDELTGLSKIAGATKNMFAQKTAGHKAFAAVEKAAAAASLAMKAQDLITTIMKIPFDVAGGVGKIFQQLGVYGFPVAAAFLALMSSLGGGNKGSTVSTVGLTAKDIQETQGTGLAWKDGQKVETGRGVFGDSEAKVDSIRESLETIRATSVAGLPLYDEMVYYLESIDRNIGSAATSLYGIQGIRTGSAFGTAEGASGSPGMLLGLIGGSSEKTSIIDSGLKLSGTLAELATGFEGAYLIYEKVLREWSDEGFLFGLFGSDAGSEVLVNIRNLNRTIEGGLNTLGQEAVWRLQNVFMNAQMMLYTANRDLGQAFTVANAAVNDLELDLVTSLKDLKGQELIDELHSLVGVALDELFTEVFGATLINEFRKFGESASQTILRVIDDKKKVVQALSNINIDLAAGLETKTFTRDTKELKPVVKDVVKSRWDWTGHWDSGGQYEEIFYTVQETVMEWVDGVETVTETVDIQLARLSEKLIEKAGGLDKFVEANKFYFEKFYTKEEQDQIIIDQVTNEINRLAQFVTNNPAAIKLSEAWPDFSSLNTADEFRSIVESIDLTIDSGQSLYTWMMKLAPAFTEVYSAVEGTTSKLDDLTIQLYKLQGKADDARTLEREKATKDLTVGEKAIQDQIFALQDALTLRKLETDLLSAQGKAHKALVRTREDELSQLTTAEQVEKQKVYAAIDQQKLAKLDIDILSAQGFAQQALLKTREQEILALSEEEAIKQRLIYAAQDAAKSASLEIQLLKLEGNNILATQKEQLQVLNGLLGEGGAITQDYLTQVAIYAQEKVNRLSDLGVELLTAEGRTADALIISRQKQLDSLTSVEEQVAKQKVFDAEDSRSQLDQEVALLRAQGKEYRALQVERVLELRGLNETDKAIRRLVYAYEDYNTTLDLNARLAELSGNVDASIALQRQRELNAASGSDRVILMQIHRQEDMNKLRQLDIELMDAQGNGYQSLLASRRLELRSLTTSEKAIKKQIYAAQDYAKTQSLYIQLLRASGQEQAATNMERELELKNLSSTDQAIQRLIWSYEDQKDAAGDLDNSIQDLVDSLGDQIKQLKEYKDSLLIGDKSTLTTAAKYTQVKNTIFDLLDIIETPAVTEEQKKVKSDAVSQIQSMSTNFLELSHLLYASSSKYTSDFDFIQSILDTAIGSLETQLSDAQKQLAATEQSNAYLGSINQALITYPEYLDLYLEENASTISNSVQEAIDALEVTIDGVNLDTITEIQTTNIYLKGIDESAYALRQNLYKFTTSFAEDSAVAFNSATREIINGLEKNAINNRRQEELSIASDTDAITLQAIYAAVDSKNTEEISKIPELITALEDSNLESLLEQRFSSEKLALMSTQLTDISNTWVGYISNFGSTLSSVFDAAVASLNNESQAELTQMVNSSNAIINILTSTNQTNQSLLAEIKRLNEQTIEVKNTVATGAVINAEATNVNTVKLTAALNDLATTTALVQKINDRIALA